MDGNEITNDRAAIEPTPCQWQISSFPVITEKAVYADDVDFITISEKRKVKLVLLRDYLNESITEHTTLKRGDKLSWSLDNTSYATKKGLSKCLSVMQPS